MASALACTSTWNGPLSRRAALKGAALGAILATGSWLPPPGTRLATAAAFVVLGPLVWLSVLTINDLHDLPGDRVNPRKSTAPLVTGGPFRFVRHPNYLVVIGEIAVLPLVFGLWQVALIFSILNAIVLTIRIRAEMGALGG